ncbi:potential E3 ubiquitin-protein ligase ariadne-2-like [Centruroides vittatus]|uniref:potential E3 ubiquitin-protein ligase ariadne-2-like n=1 Tax=Centruroides vittatus TaxID=120091 RepID=UPI0035106F80
MAEIETVSEVDEDNEIYDDYFNTDDVELEEIRLHNDDPEYFKYECLQIEDAEQLLNTIIDTVSKKLQITSSMAKILLHTHNWALEDSIEPHMINQILANARIKPLFSSIQVETQLLSNKSESECSVCYRTISVKNFNSLACEHQFCRDCWCSHLAIKILEGVSINIECMQQKCHILVLEDFVINILSSPLLKEKYKKLIFSECISSHPELRFCPGSDCSIVIRAKEVKSKRVICSSCKIQFCFKCGTAYHAPNDCETIKNWILKCSDDSETANYICAHTKDCPMCQVTIEKNGGCNHMKCYNCKHEFCWMCLNDWKCHGTQYYHCSIYDENADDSSSQAKHSLKKYLFYYERWQNHANSLKLEEQTLQQIKNKINDKVMSNQGTWIDWQYLIDGANLLANCRYTLQYTYPYAYYLSAGPRKELFEYQQAQLEAEIENLSWKIERAESTDQADLQVQMDIAEKRRTTLLKDFLIV